MSNLTILFLDLIACALTNLAGLVLTENTIERADSSQIIRPDSLNACIKWGQCDAIYEGALVHPVGDIKNCVAAWDKISTAWSTASPDLGYQLLS